MFLLLIWSFLFVQDTVRHIFLDCLDLIAREKDKAGSYTLLDSSSSVTSSADRESGNGLSDLAQD